MKKLSYILTGLMIIVIMIMTAFSISSAQITKSIKGNTTLELNRFSVNSPSGDDWEYFITPDKNIVQFIYESSDFLSGKENSTFAVVLKDSVFTKIDKSEKEYADEFLEENLNGFISNEYMNIIRSRKFDTSIAGRYLFAVSSAADDHDFAVPPTYADILFFIFFPDDFKTTRTFYRFQIAGYYNLPLGKKNSNESDLKPIYSIVKSFRMEEPAAREK